MDPFRRAIIGDHAGLADMGDQGAVYSMSSMSVGTLMPSFSKPSA